MMTIMMLIMIVIIIIIIIIIIQMLHIMLKYTVVYGNKAQHTGQHKKLQRDMT